MTYTRQFLASLVALTLVGACGDSANESGATAGASGEISALAYNVAGLPEGISGSMPATFMPLIGPKLNAYDLVLVQESWQTPDPNPFAPTRTYHEELVSRVDHPYLSIPAEAPLGTDPRRPDALLADGLGRFSRYPFDPVTRVAWDDCDITSADCLAFKGFSYARTQIAPGVEIDVYNLHMEAGGSANDERIRGEGITQMLDVLTTFSAGRAVIIGGDFNLHTDEEPDKSQYERLLRDAGLTDACAALDCPEPARIDKMAFRNGGGVEVEALSWEFAVDEFTSPDGTPLSDHDPLAVRFAWRTAG
ncbi:MAG: hypothetical protein P8R42_30110 [Candidatus Binatia bacterium]|nr:hypothetical protein [Candidatus Binatia bacterium]